MKMLELDRELDSILKFEVEGYKRLSSSPQLDEKNNINFKFLDYRDVLFDGKITPVGEIVYVEPLEYLLDSIGLDSALCDILPLSYLQGQVGVYRQDATKRNGKKCGKGWIKEGFECRIKGSRRTKSKIRSMRSRLSVKNASPPSRVNKRSGNAGKIFAGVGLLAAGGVTTASIVSLSGKANKVSQGVSDNSSAIDKFSKKAKELRNNILSTQSKDKSKKNLENNVQTSEAKIKANRQKAGDKESQITKIPAESNDFKSQYKNLESTVKGKPKGFALDVTTPSSTKKQKGLNFNQLTKKQVEKEKKVIAEEKQTELNNKKLVKEIDFLKSTISKQEEHNKKQKDQIVALQSQISSENIKNSSDVKQLSSQLKESKKNVDKLKLDVAKYTEEADKYKNQLDKLSRDKIDPKYVAHTEKRLSQSKVSNKNLAIKNRELAEDLGKEKEATEFLSKEIKALSREADKYQDKLIRSQEAVKAQSALKGQAIREKAELKYELKNTEKELDKIVSKLDEARKQLVTDDERVKKIQSDVDELERALIAYPTPKPSQGSTMRAINQKVLGQTTVGIAGVDTFNQKSKGGSLRKAKDVSSSDKFQELKSTKEGQRFIKESIKKSKEYAEHWNKVEFGDDSIVPDIEFNKQRQKAKKKVEGAIENTKKIIDDIDNSSEANKIRQIQGQVIDVVSEDLTNIGNKGRKNNQTKISQAINYPGEKAQEIIDNLPIKSNDWNKLLEGDAETFNKITQGRTIEQVYGMIDSQVGMVMGPKVQKIYQTAVGDKFKYDTFMRWMNEAADTAKDETPTTRREFFQRLRNKVAYETYRSQSAEKDTKRLSGDLLDLLDDQLNPARIKPGSFYDRGRIDPVSITDRIAKYGNEGLGSRNAILSRGYKLQRGITRDQIVQLNRRTSVARLLDLFLGL